MLLAVLHFLVNCIVFPVNIMANNYTCTGSTLIMNSIVNLTSTMHTSSDLSGDSTAAAAVSILLAIFVLAAVSMIVVILIVLKRKRKTKEAMITSIIYTNTDSEILKESGMNNTILNL